MKEITGDLWDHFDKPHKVICITTNGSVKLNGNAVMGRGCALEAAQKFQRLPGVVGRLIRSNGNIVQQVPSLPMLLFPVKSRYMEDGDPEMIVKSARDLSAIAWAHPNISYILPRPGCGAGHLKWENVRPLIDFLPDNVEVITRVITNGQ